MHNPALTSRENVTVLAGDRDWSYATRTSDLARVQRLARGIQAEGLLAGALRPLRAHLLGRMIGTTINFPDDDESQFAERNQPLTPVQLAAEIVQQ